MKLITNILRILLIPLTTGNLLDGINQKIIKPVQKAIFGEADDSNVTVIIERGAIWNLNRQLQNYRERQDLLKVDIFENVETLIVNDDFDEIEISNTFPEVKLGDDCKLENILFYNVSDIDEDRLLSNLKTIKNVQIRHSNIQGFSDAFITELTQIDFHLKLRDSWWCCDCTKLRLLRLRLPGLDVKCQVPFDLEAESFHDIDEEDLKCSRTKNPKPIENSVKAMEYQLSELKCAALGYPLPKIVWVTPGGRRLDNVFLTYASTNESLKEYAETFNIQERVTDRIIPSSFYLLSTLVVRNVNKRTAGRYKCQVANIVDALGVEPNTSSIEFDFYDIDVVKSTVITLSYLPDEKANVAFFTLVLTCFTAAFIINLVNICRYHCDWKKRIKSLRKDPKRYEIPESIRTSMASVYYDKYDSTCQQAFLDALLKSSHAVKKTFENTTQGFEINVSYRDFSEKFRENFGSHAEWRPSMPSVRLPHLTNITGSLTSLRDRIGMPGLPKSMAGFRPSMNLHNLSGDWNMKVRISKFSRKWFYGCSESPSNINEFQIRNENGRVVITPIQEKNDLKTDENSIEEEGSESSSSLSPNHSSLPIDDVDSDYLLTIIATPKSPKISDHLYESNV